MLQLMLVPNGRVVLRYSLQTVTYLPLLSMLAATSAGQSKADQTSDRATAATAAAPDSMAGHNMSGMSDAMHSMSGMAGMMGNADQNFLRMMSDHHKRLIAMAHLTVESDRKGSEKVQVDRLKGQSGAAYNRTFYENVVKHHHD